MAPAAAAPSRKRNRKRKRRAASPSSSSSSSSSSESESDSPKQTIVRRLPAKKRVPSPLATAAPSSSSSSSSSSESDSEPEKPPTRTTTVVTDVPESHAAVPSRARIRTPSPTPLPADIPAFAPDGEDAADASVQGRENEQALRARFRTFWMASLADAFKDDLEQIRKEPQLTASRLTMLIDSLASGADAYSPNEMEVVLGGQ